MFSSPTVTVGVVVGMTGVVAVALATVVAVEVGVAVGGVSVVLVAVATEAEVEVAVGFTGRVGVEAASVGVAVALGESGGCVLGVARIVTSKTDAQVTVTELSSEGS